MAPGGPETMLYLIAYDISNDRRRTRIHKLLCGFGQWTQFSLFECWLTKRQLLDLQHKLEQLMNRAEDSVRLYCLCATCAARTQTVGGDPPADPIVVIL